MDFATSQSLVTLLSSRGWLDPVQNLETVLGYSQDRIRDLVDGSQMR